jgi:hypothetical protein
MGLAGVNLPGQGVLHNRLFYAGPVADIGRFPATVRHNRFASLRYPQDFGFQFPRAY